MVSKVQSLKLDTSVWSNEIVQVKELSASIMIVQVKELNTSIMRALRSILYLLPVIASVSAYCIESHAISWVPACGVQTLFSVSQLFIMLGNDRANEFWAARLTAVDELDCDAMPEQRREFIVQKYREGRFRCPHPSFGTQEELLKVPDLHQYTKTLLPQTVGDCSSCSYDCWKRAM